MYGSVGQSSLHGESSGGGENGRGRIINNAHSIQHHHPQITQKRTVLKKEFGFLNMTALVVNNMLGSATFIAPALILQYSGSIGLSLLLWLVGGVITTLASLCYLELALLVKKSGSTYVYIKEAFSFGRSKPWMEGVGSMISFLMVWTDLVIIQPVSTAIGYLSMGHYLCRPFFIHCQEMPPYAVKMFALFVLTLLTIVNLYSVKIPAKVLTWLSSIKFLVFAFIVVLGVWKLIENRSFPEDSRHPFEGSTMSFSNITLGLYGVMWAYDGWTGGLMIQEEAKGVRTVKWMMFVSMPVVIVVYLLVNTAFFTVLSYDQIRHSEAVGLLFGEALFGTAGVVVFSVFIVLIMIGSAQAGIYERSRELFVASREGDMPRFISGIHISFKTPILSIVLSNLAVAVYILIGNLQHLINVFNATEWFWYGVGILGLIIMRLTLPNKHRPFEVIMLLPSVMVVVSILLVVLPLWQDPLPQLIGFAGVLAGLPVYVVFVMEKPWRLKPKLLDVIGKWLVGVSGKLFNTELADAF